ncbi:MAG: RsmB/NOP family class I SAM-dependent RNA methyltransferase [archaeon]|nr:RsmB/NOP family class I SAM-dependent RNA methyltransferase [archaeon]
MARKTFIPPQFREKYSKIMGEEANVFFEVCRTKWPKSIWVNSLKIRPSVLKKSLEKKGWVLDDLFHENAFAISGVERPGGSEEFAQGLFNAQEKSSMLPALVLAPKKNDLVLDATAAPGNKTLQLACLMEGRGKIVAVEKNVERFKSLRFNMKKFGARNVILKRMDLLDAKKNNLFDKALLDAPCSSEGLVRKDFEALKNWSQELVEKKAALQKKLLAKTIELLKEGGEVVYSTCSLSPEENEEVVQSALDAGGAKILGFEFAGMKLRQGFRGYNGKKFDGSISKCARIYPQDNDSQGFFIAKIRKTAT